MFWAATLLLGCGSGDSSRSPIGAHDGGIVCPSRQCCDEVGWMLIAPVETGLGGKIDFDVGVAPNPHRPFDVRWTAEGGDVDKGRSQHASYTCKIPGVHRVSLTISNPYCEMSQDSHIECVD
jgi:hypothetical protein